ncbi:MAG TPA: PadR family transcriptional regulator [Gemmatimonadaceae bacterium]
MANASSRERDSLVLGTLDLLVLRILVMGEQHGQGIAREIEERSGKNLIVDHGSLYPALQRLEDRKWVSGTWGVSANNRRARFYALTAAGRRQLSVEAERWHRLVESIGRVLGPDWASA